MGIGGHQPAYPNQTPNTVKTISGVSLRAITFVVERARTQTAS